MLQCVLLMGALFIGLPDGGDAFNATHYSEYSVDPCKESPTGSCLWARVPGVGWTRFGGVPAGISAVEALTLCEAQAMEGIEEPVTR